ncbi:MAG: hypothetical protein AB7T06_13475 [Kofleriaceae bacterium]
MTRSVLLATALGVAGCTSFEDPTIVVDMRPLAMTAEPPEQLVTLDPSDPPEPVELLAQLAPTRVCALVVDPQMDRRIRYEMRICTDALGDRCGDPQVVIASGVIDDPDTTTPAPALCATIEPNGNLLGVLVALLESDAFGGLGGLDYNVVLRFGGEGADPALDQYASKHVRVAPKIPVARTPNANPTLRRLEGEVDDSGDNRPLQTGRCVDQDPLVVTRGQRVKLSPIEPDEAREPYLTPTLDGQGAMFVESLTYQWLASDGGFSNAATGGPRDAFGNVQPIDTEWRAPTDIRATTDVDIYVVQRDERLGSNWYTTCVRVML